jgi:hypothetical protein
VRLRLYTVHRPPAAVADEAELVKEGFCWPALFFGPFWAAWHRLWLWAVGLLLVMAVLTLIGELWPSADAVASVAGLAVAALFAGEANDLRRRDLARHGWRKIGVIGGPGIDSAHRRFVDLSALSPR